jgi:hypothetical protein
MADNAKRDLRVVAAISGLREFMNENLAASKIELEAKLIDSHFDHPPFEPAHLHDARKYLVSKGELTVDRSTTRGGGTPPILITTDRNNRSRKVDDAAARKRLLMSRYYSYVQGGDDARSSLAGPAGELAFQAALTRASVGASIATTTRGMPSLPRVFGEDIPIGPMDNGFILQPLDKTTLTAIPPFGIHVLVEVKNVREWIYPRTQELYQLLAKSARVQQAHPDQKILPVLVCRKAHITTTFMAKELGFFVIQAGRQFLPESSLIDPIALSEMTAELGISDLVQGTESTTQIENKLRTLQRYFDLDTATNNWQSNSHSDDFRQFAQVLYDDAISNKLRDKTLNDLRTWAKGDRDSLGW